MTDQDEASPPLLTVLTPGATPEQVAALVAVVTALGSADQAPRPPGSRWASTAHRLLATPRPSPGAWRASALPR